MPRFHLATTAGRWTYELPGPTPLVQLAPARGGRDPDGVPSALSQAAQRDPVRRDRHAVVLAGQDAGTRTLTRRLGVDVATSAHPPWPPTLPRPVARCQDSPSASRRWQTPRFHGGQVTGGADGLAAAHAGFDVPKRGWRAEVWNNQSMVVVHNGNAECPGLSRQCAAERASWDAWAAAGEGRWAAIAVDPARGLHPSAPSDRPPASRCDRGRVRPSSARWAGDVGWASGGGNVEGNPALEPT